LRVDGVFLGHGLRVRNINRLALDQALIVSVDNFFRAFRGALTAGDAFAHIHISGMLDHLDLKVAFFAADGGNF